MIKDYQELPDGRIMYEGRIYAGINSVYRKVKFSPKRWFSHWRARIKEIKKLRLDYRQITFIHDDFVHDVLSYSFLKQIYKKHQEVNQLSTELKIALEQAYTNYRDSKKGLWAFISGIFMGKILEKNLQIPQIPLNIKEVKNE